VEYVPPRDDRYQRSYEEMRRRRLLENLAQALAFIRLPRPLSLRLDECDGESNAWYDEDEHVATFCYEWLDELLRDGAARGGDDAVLGPVVFMYLHEIGHAVFHMLGVPILGREEDAADQLATLILLRAGPEAARGTLDGAARMFAPGAEPHVPDESELADVHSLDAQRYYNLLCLVYGSDPDAYAALAKDNRLPPDRADGCEQEYQQVVRAARQLLARHFDVGARRE
jgi:hypothetical protein